MICFPSVVFHLVTLPGCGAVGHPVLKSEHRSRLHQYLAGVERGVSQVEAEAGVRGGGRAVAGDGQQQGVLVLHQPGHRGVVAGQVEARNQSPAPVNIK